jgi:hypothetical protein
LKRAIFLFDTSALSGGTPTAATIGLYCNSGVETGLGSFEVDIVSSNPNANTTLQNDDYADLGTTVFSSKASGIISATTMISFSLNADGLTNISKTGISKFGARINWDTDNSFGGTWASSVNSAVYFNDGGYTGTTRDPKIDITYTLPATGNINLTLLGVG